MRLSCCLSKSRYDKVFLQSPSYNVGSDEIGVGVVNCRGGGKELIGLLKNEAGGDN